MNYYADYFDLTVVNKDDIEGWVYGLVLYVDSDGLPVASISDDPYTCIQVVLRCLSDTLMGQINQFMDNKSNVGTFKRLPCTVETGTEFYDAWIHVETSEEEIKNLTPYFEGD